MREAEVDGNAASFLFSEPIRVSTGESFYKSGFAVIDVTGGADDDVAHGSSFIVAFPTAHIRAEMETANPTASTKITGIFQIME